MHSFNVNIYAWHLLIFIEKYPSQKYFAAERGGGKGFALHRPPPFEGGSHLLKYFEDHWSSSLETCFFFGATLRCSHPIRVSFWRVWRSFPKVDLGAY
jgi:hypothetical protein